MSILINGMEMPEVCADCPFRSIPELSMLKPNCYHYISRCTRVSEEIEDPWRDTLWQLEHKESWCPLIEVPTPHGRLIDADALDDMDFETCDTDDWYPIKERVRGKNQIRKIVKDAPTADAVPVVRCKDCKYSDHWYSDKRRCFLWNEAGIDVFEDGFCNYAERRETE